MKLAGIGLPIAAPALLIAMQASHAQQIGRGYEPPLLNDGQVHSENKTVSFGGFAVTRNVVDYRAAPIIDGPWLTKEAVLDWHDSTGRVGFSFVDDGTSVRFTPRGTSADGKTTCFTSSIVVGYDPAPTTAENWRSIQPFVRRWLRACGVIASADLDRVAKELTAGTDDYVTAANAWKGVAKELFGPSGRRCIAERMERPFTIPPRFVCTKYSKP